MYKYCSFRRMEESTVCICMEAAGNLLEINHDTGPKASTWATVLASYICNWCVFIFTQKIHKRGEGNVIVMPRDCSACGWKIMQIWGEKCKLLYMMKCIYRGFDQGFSASFLANIELRGTPTVFTTVNIFILLASWPLATTSWLHAGTKQ